VANQRIVAHLVRQVESENDDREMHDAQHVLAFQQSRMEEETARRLESDTLAGQTGRTCHPILRRVPRRPGESPVTVKSQLPSAALEKVDAMRMLGRAAAPGAGNEESLSAYDHYEPNAMDETKLREMLTRLASHDDAVVAADARRRLGLTSPHPGSMAGTGKQKATVDLVTGPTTIVSPVGPRSDVPLTELLHAVLAAEEDVPSAERLEQLRLVDRVRDCFARSTTKGGQPIHLPRSTIERAILVPDDRPYEECVKLLPRPGSAFAANPFPDVKKDKKKPKGKKAATDKK
jgi:hypothetical protein